MCLLCFEDLFSEFSPLLIDLIFQFVLFFVSKGNGSGVECTLLLLSSMKKSNGLLLCNLIFQTVNQILKTHITVVKFMIKPNSFMHANDHQTYMEYDDNSYKSNYLK